MVYCSKNIKAQSNTRYDFISRANVFSTIFYFQVQSIPVGQPPLESGRVKVNNTKKQKKVRMAEMLWNNGFRGEIGCIRSDLQPMMDILIHWEELELFLHLFFANMLNGTTTQSVINPEA